jgi:hypothetical protein
MQYIVHTKRYLKGVAEATLIIDAESEEQANDLAWSTLTEDMEKFSWTDTKDSDTTVREIPELKG